MQWTWNFFHKVFNILEQMLLLSHVTDPRFISMIFIFAICATLSMFYSYKSQYRQFYDYLIDLSPFILHLINSILIILYILHKLLEFNHQNHSNEFVLSYFYFDILFIIYFYSFISLLSKFIQIKSICEWHNSFVMKIYFTHAVFFLFDFYFI